LARFDVVEMGRPSCRSEHGGSSVHVEDVFRNANERVAEKARELKMQDPIPFLCECSDKRCFVHIHLSLAEYEDARSDPTRYLTVSGHEVVVGACGR
jgi:hypothetical protein